jgi:tetratricopeptide (TPR) repeat protein
MNGRTRVRLSGVLCLALAAWPRLAAAQDSLAAARELYVSAAYEDALDMLSRLQTADVGRDEGRRVDEYRAFCFLALGKKADAERTIEALVSADPSFRPSDDDASPRMRAAFSEVRRRLLPALVQRQYAQAKAAFDAKSYERARDEFSQTLELLSDSDLGAAAATPPLSDLRVLVTGFLDLSRQAAAPPPRPAAPAPVEVPPARPAAPAPTSPAPPARDPSLVYTIDTPKIVPPVVVRESLPRFVGRLPAPAQGALEVVIDEAGTVTSAAMRRPVNPNYDKLVVAAAQTWRYTPAMLDGLPVKYRKMITVSIVPQ